MNATKQNGTTKKVVIGILSFAGATLLALTIAITTIALQNGAKQGDNDLVVGNIEQTAITFKDVSFSNRRFCFEPALDDDSGRVRSNGKSGEALSSTLTFRFTNFEMVKGINLKLWVPDGIVKAASKGYLHLPLIASNQYGYTIPATGQYVSDYVVNGKVSTYEKCFSYVISFSWGSVFHGKNPGEYYDLDVEGRAVSNEDMKTTLEDFYTLVHGEGESASRQTMSLDLTPILN